MLSDAVIIPTVPFIWLLCLLNSHKTVILASTPYAIIMIGNIENEKSNAALLRLTITKEGSVTLSTSVDNT